MVMFVFGMSLVIITPLLTDISDEFHLSLAQSGLFFSANFIGFITFIFIGGILAEKYGKMKIVASATFGLVLSLTAFGLAQDVSLAFISALFIGGFGGIMESMVSSLLADLHPERSDYYINLSQVFLCVGAVLSPLVGSWLLSNGYGWRNSYFILALIAFIVFIAFVLCKIEESAVLEKVKFRSIVETFADKKFLVVCFCVFLYVGAESGAWGWMPTFLKKGMGISIHDAAIIVGAFWVAMTVGRIICGKLTKYLPVGKFIVILAGLSALVVILSSLLQGKAAMFLISIGLGLAFSSQYPFLLAIGSKLRTNATSFALIVGFGGLGNVLVPPIVGWVADVVGIRIAMMSTSVLFMSLVAILLLSGYWRLEKK